MPFISVIIPVYNVEKYLKRCVDSLTSQNYNDYEIILVDDGSTDNSGRLCDEIAVSTSAVTAVHKTNGGLGSARNYGLNFVKGEYVTFVDSDDYVTKNYFEIIDKHLKQNSPDILKYGYQKVKDGIKGQSVAPYFEEGYYDRSQMETDILPGAVGPIRLFDYSKDALMSACVCAYSIRFLEKNKIRFQSEREILNEDHLFNFSALLCAKSVEILHDLLYIYDYREGSLSKHYRSHILERKQRLLQEYKKILQDNNAFELFESSFYAQCVDSYYACFTNECGNWSAQDKEAELEQVKQILELNDCQLSLRKCRHNGLGMKGTIIYWLMRTKQANLMCLLYRLTKKVYQ